MQRLYSFSCALFYLKFVLFFFSAFSCRKIFTRGCIFPWIISHRISTFSNFTIDLLWQTESQINIIPAYLPHIWSVCFFIHLFFFNSFPLVWSKSDPCRDSSGWKHSKASQRDLGFLDFQSFRDGSTSHCQAWRGVLYWCVRPDSQWTMDFTFSVSEFFTFLTD